MSKNKKHFPWPLAIFPMIECLLFVCACFFIDTKPLVSIILVFLAAFVLSFSVHIFFHECIHYSTDKPLNIFFQWMASLLIGLPFDGYRVHHYNHHQYDNHEGDFSSTFQFIQNEQKPYRLWSYILGWPRQLVRCGIYLRNIQDDKCEWLQSIKARMPAQRSFILIGVTFLALLSWKYAIMYISLVYIGWAFISLQNYGQHHPSLNGEASTLSSTIYNKLFFNNGLHWEHHAQPNLPWNELSPHELSPKIHKPHILNFKYPQNRNRR